MEEKAEFGRGSVGPVKLFLLILLWLGARCWFDTWPFWPMSLMEEESESEDRIVAFEARLLTCGDVGGS